MLTPHKSITKMSDTKHAPITNLILVVKKKIKIEKRKKKKG
jgi:hypothetical protein